MNAIISFKERAKPTKVKKIMKYRPEIDGLRTVAVVPVILFHAGVTLFSGGYVGVDVFFVISGYLITTILINELEEGEFSILRFYERRARRILPALFFVLVITSILAWIWLLPGQLSAYSKSLIAVVLFVSNIFFWRSSDYFSPAAEELPLLHTWSLAVEEQYYLFFPIVLAFLWKFGRKPVGLVLIITTLISLVLCEWAARFEPRANFYLIPTRAWELLVGSLCAFVLTRKSLSPSQTLSAAGLALIVVPILIFDGETPFPSLYALAPVLGTALIILYAGQGTLVSRLLSTAPFVGIGLISYSAYLWHQPLFAFARIRSLSEPSQILMLGLAMLAMGLAYLSWRFVERPFRHRGKPGSFSRAQIFALSGGAIAATVATAGVSISLGGDLGRYSATQLAHLDHVRRGYSHPQVEAGCFKGFHGSDTAPCMVGDADSETLVVVMGDSHARQWVGALDQIGNSAGWQVAIYAKAACAAPRVSYVYARLGRTYRECDAWRDGALAEITQSAPDVVLMTSSSAGYLTIEDANVSFADWASGLEASFDSAGGAEVKKIWLFDNPRSAHLKPYKCYAQSYLSGRGTDHCAIAMDEAINDEIRTLETAAASRAGATFLDFTDAYCDDGTCQLVQDAVLLLVDSNHLSLDTTERMMPALEAAIRSELGGG